MDDPFTNAEIMNGQVVMRLPNSTTTTDTWYFATYTGPGFPQSDGSTGYTYMASCALNSGGNVDGIVMFMVDPTVQAGQGGGT